MMEQDSARAVAEDAAAFAQLMVTSGPRSVLPLLFPRMKVLAV
jgi:hypothetical protein